MNHLSPVPQRPTMSPLLCHHAEAGCELDQLITGTLFSLYLLSIDLMSFTGAACAFSRSRSNRLCLLG